MDELRIFIKAWEETGSIAALLERGLVLPPAEIVQSHLSSLPDAEQKEIRLALASIMDALEIYSADLEKETALIREQLDQNRKNAKACLSYNSADLMHRK